MKNIYLLFAALFMGQSGFSQNATVSLSQSTVCVGDVVTATVEPPQLELATPASIANQQNGVMFDVIGISAAVIQDFAISPLMDNSEVEVYYRTGSFVGFEDASVGWTLVGTSTVNSGTEIPLGLTLDIDILAGQTLGFYVTCTDGLDVMFYDGGTQVGDQLAATSILRINEGVGKAYPFDNTFTTRNFVGKVIYEPILTDITWNVGSGTSQSLDFNATNTTAVVANVSYGAWELQSDEAILYVPMVEVEVTANPEVLGWDQSSTLTAAVVATTGLPTTFAGGNSYHGAMFDVEAINDLTVKGFSISAIGDSADIEIFYKAGTYVGSETNIGAWISVGSYTDVSNLPSTYLALSIELDMVAGQTFGFYITRIDNDNLSYTFGAGGVGTEFANDGVMRIRVGSGVQFPLGGFLFPNRVLNCIVHYSSEVTSGVSYSWQPTGGIGGSALVTPNQDITYTLTATVDGCDGVGDASVSMAVGIEEVLKNNFKVFPNPANNMINLTAVDPVDLSSIELMEIGGRIVYSQSPNSLISQMQIPVSQLADGIYFLRLKMNDGEATFRVVVQK